VGCQHPLCSYPPFLFLAKKKKKKRKREMETKE
jgi:hypothetical protein